MSAALPLFAAALVVRRRNTPAAPTGEIHPSLKHHVKTLLPLESMNDLFTPSTIGEITLPNRIIMSPLTRSRAAKERVPNELMAEY